MATNYPGALDTLTNPIGTDALNSATVPHAQQHANANDAIEAIQAELGVNPKGSSATVVARLNGTAVLGSANAFTVGGHTITAETAAIIPLRINAAASQSGNLLEFRNSAGTLLTNINNSGQFVNTVSIANNDYGNRTSFGNAKLQLLTTGATLTTTVAANIPLTIQNTHASPTADLTIWLNTGGTALATMGSGGAFRSTSVNTLTDYAGLREANSGGFLRMTKQTAASANIAANVASFYLRDGTNAGTLKFVVRAGASGAETTILDNIPQ